MNIIYMMKYEQLSAQEAAKILRRPDKSKISTLPACNPKCGQLFLYSYEGCKHKRNDWRHDQLRWVQKGRRLFPKGQPLVRKSYFQRLINGQPVRFHRYGYDLPDGSVDRVIVHYLGQNERPPGNMKKYLTRSYVRTMPSAFKKVVPQKYDRPSKVCQPLMATSSSLPGYEKMTLPRFIQQIKNKIMSEKKKNQETKKPRISYDDFCAVYELCHALGGFICQCSVIPEWFVILALPEIISIFEEVAATNKTTVLSYDTTFQLGDLYVSPLVFQYTFFEEKPAIPLAVLIHDKRSRRVHETFFECIQKRVPQINNDSTVIVTDRDAAILQGIQTGIPHCLHVLCWNHIIKDVELWVSAHERGKADRKVYCDNILQLLDCESEREFVELFRELKVRWSASFLGYFEQELQEVIVTKSGRWLLEKRGIYKERSGITTNVSEGMNAMLKGLCNEKVQNMNEIIRAFYFLQTYYLKESLRGLCDIGNYHLLVEFSNRKLNPDDVQFPKDYIPPDDIVHVIKQGKMQTDQESKVQRAGPKSKTMQDIPHFMVRQNRIYLQAQSGSFIVRGFNEKEYVVKLFPTETCTCTSSGTCHHIMAAQISIGKSIHPNKIMYSLKKLRMSTRKGKSGRNKPRQKDELTKLAASDSTLRSSYVATDVIPKEKVTSANKMAGKEREIFSLALDLEPEVPTFSSIPRQANQDLQISQSVPWDCVKSYPRMRSTYVQRVFISAEDMKCLLDNNWLVDTVIEGFLFTRTMLTTVTTTDVDVSVFDPFIMHSMELHGYTTNVHNFGINSDAMSKDIWLIPTNVWNAHWILIMVFLKWKIILYLDSNQGFSTDYTDLLQTFMEKQTVSPIDWSEWTIHAPVDIPVQQDSFNCGIFVCLFAHVLCSGSAVPFPADMTPIRQWIATELLRQESFLQQSSFTPRNHKRTKEEIREAVRSNFQTPISRGAPKGSSSTIGFLSSAVRQYYTSSWSLCLMGDLCKKPKNDEMILCQGACQDWYHLSCLNETQVPCGVFKCPLCFKQ